MKKLSLAFIVFVISLFIFTNHVHAEVTYQEVFTSDGLRALDNATGLDDMRLIYGGESGYFMGDNGGFATPLAIVNRITLEGTTPWGVTGINLDTTSSAINTLGFDIAWDGADGMFAVWRGDRSGYKPFFQHLDANGNELLTANGVQLTDLPAGASDAAIEPDGAGGVFITYFWNDGGVYKVEVARLDENGSAIWGPTTIHSGGSAIQILNTTVDDNDNFFVAYEDTNNDPTIAKITLTGTDSWSGGYTIGDYSTGSFGVSLIPDYLGGAYVAWFAQSGTGFNDVILQRINSSGSAVFSAPGVKPINNDSIDQERPVLAPDGSGGVFMTWEDYEFDPNIDTYTQRYNSSGVAQWAGPIFSSTDYWTEDPQIVTDDRGGVIIVAESGTNILAQRLDSTGARQFTSGGIFLHNLGNAESIETPLAISDGKGGVVSTWFDDRQTNDNIYIQRIRSGYEVTNVGGSLRVLDVLGNDVDTGSAEVVSGSAVLLYLTNTTGDYGVSFEADLSSSDLDLSGVSVEVDGENGISSVTGLTQGHRVFVKKLPIHDHLYICPDATSNAEAVFGCTNGYIDYDATIVSLGGENYWRSSQVFSTGGLGIFVGDATMRIELANESSSASDDIEVWFDTPVTNITQDSLIYVSYDNNFTGGSSLTQSDIDVTCDTDGLSPISGTGMTAVTISGFTNGYFEIDTNTDFCSNWIVIDINGDGGNLLTNPSSPGNYSWSIAYDAAGDGSVEADGATLAYVDNENDIDITAYVPPVIDMELYQTGVDTLLNGTGANTCELGVLSINTISTCTYDIGTGTNNTGGVSVYIQSDGGLRDGNGNEIAACSGTNCDSLGSAGVTAGEEEYGIYISELGNSEYVAGGSFGTQHQGIPTIETLFASSSSTGSGTTTGSVAQRLEVTHAASVSTATVQGSYSHIVTYTAFTN